MDTQIIATDNKNSDLSVETRSQMMFQVYEVLTERMGQLLDSFKSVDRRFAKIADRFLAANNELYNKSNPNEDDIRVILTNLAYGAAAKGVGSLLTTIKTSQALAQVKVVLKSQAEQNLPEIEHYLEEIPEIETSLLNNLNTLWASNAPLNSVKKAFDRLRAVYYAFLMANYLKSTYEAALRDTLQHSAPYPTMYEVNQKLLYGFLTDTPQASSDEQILANRKQSISGLIDAATQSIEKGTQLRGKVKIFLADEQLMATALHDYVPLDPDLVDEDGFSPTMEDCMVLASMSEYMKFINLGSTAEENPNNEVSKIVRSNKALMDFTNHIMSHYEVTELYKTRETIYSINLWLIGVLSFLAAWERLDLAWYWALCLGVVGILVARCITPVNSMTKRFKKKLTYIERTIQMSNLIRAGYQEPITLVEIDNTNNKAWFGLIIGGILGFCFIPFPGGLIIGALIGVWLGRAKNDDPNPDYDYNKVDLGSDWKAKVIMVCLILCVLAYIGMMIFGK